MLPYHFDRAFDFSAGKSQAPHDFRSHLRTQTVVPAKANAPRLVHGGGTRLGHIVQQHGENERYRDFLRQKVSVPLVLDRKSTRLNSSHPSISYAGFCLKKKNSGGTSGETTTDATPRICA